jgi:hypothetical protein
MDQSRRGHVVTLSTTTLVFIVAALVALVYREPERAPAKPRLFNRHSVATMLPHQKGESARRDADGAGGPEQEQYENRAFPGTHISVDRREQAEHAFESVSGREHGKWHAWEEVGPTTPLVAGEATYTGRATTDSGRVTALALSARCRDDECILFVGAAGGGVWRTGNALAAKPAWEPSGSGIRSNAIGSIIFDPTDPTGRTMYVGTGEPNGSGDSEAGVGLYRSDNGGRSWSLVQGSIAAAAGRSIGAVAVDPANRNHLLIGTAVARHGSSSANGGRFTPPGAPQVGVYESTNGGATFTLVFSRPSDVVNPATANGSDFFRGGVTRIETDRTGLRPNDPTRFYFSVFDYGLYRSTASGAFEQVFASAGNGDPANSAGSRTEFALAPMGNKLRIYLGDTDGGAADFYRTDDANRAVPLTWMKLSNPAKGTPGFSSYNYCGGQCSYDMPVASPAGHPDVVWIGGQMQYDEIFTPNPPSNGRTVMRSTDAGVSFTDMTNDTRTPPLGMHPDQHAMAFVSGSPDVALLGSDGGVVRTSGRFADASADCDTRGLSAIDLADCKAWLSAVPTRITSLNDGLATLQFQSVSINAQNPMNDVMGGTQDNGTWAFNGRHDDEKRWFESVGGDGGQSGINRANPLIRMHTYTGPAGDVTFKGTDPLGWDWMSDGLFASGEAASFYVPLINDPKVGGTWFIGLQHVWRTTDNGGPQAYLDLHCNEFTGDFSVPCGDWAPLGGPAGPGKPGDLVSALYGPTKGGSYVVATARAPSDTNTMWVATRRGRLFISKNGNAANPTLVTFTRIDGAAQPRRFISGIAVDPVSPNHAYVSFSGYNAYTPATPGHVFEVTYDPGSGTAAWTDVSYDLGDQPITGIAFDPESGDLFAATDFGVLMLASGGGNWRPAATNLPPVAVYGLTMDADARVLYAATHGRGIWRLKLQDWD